MSLVLYPAQVQGEGASDTIVRGIKYLDGRVDVIIVGRGGGSIEDLWAFNEEKTARAVFECKTPIISAVGHETDTTITDYAADLRAPTPSAGAELAVYDYGRFMKDLAVLHERLYDSMADRIEAVRQGIKNREAFLRKNSPGHKLELKKQWIENAGSVLKRSMENVLNNKKNELKRAAVRLEGVNPVRKLESGFSYVTDEKGKNVNRIAAVKAGDRLIMHVTDGEILTTVNEVKEGYGGKKADQRSES